MNKCVFDNLVRLTPLINTASMLALRGFDAALLMRLQKLEKVIPGTPHNELPVHLRPKQTYAHSVFSYKDTHGTPSEGRVEATERVTGAQGAKS